MDEAPKIHGCPNTYTLYNQYFTCFQFNLESDVHTTRRIREETYCKAARAGYDVGNAVATAELAQRR